MCEKNAHWYTAFIVTVIAIGTVNAQGTCTIRNVDGRPTQLSGVQPLKWSEAVGPSGSGPKYDWFLSLCTAKQGICRQLRPRATYPAFIQQKAPHGGCEQNAWFSTYTGGSGGQGTPIVLHYEGNPVLEPPSDRAANVTITCNPKGSYNRLDGCKLSVTRSGDTYVYDFQCTSKIACYGAPPMPPPVPTPPPSPPPPPPPSACSCTFLLWENDYNCTSHTSEVKRVSGGMCTTKQLPFDRAVAVELSQRCKAFRAFNGTTCKTTPLTGIAATNKCVPAGFYDSVMVACDF
eukprot:TRINITY_DN67254_c7_g1_i1.p1 TRINITY_DN67254_c7_g1~~TRINITY_DN67254_c7_g1_i1.p1  ORF type:complete len:290 (-),score=3.33 TRINITY_DN67254_c7_g1_i1:11-880(-)